MNIVIDLRPLIGSKVSGVTVYMSNLIAELERIDKDNQYYFFVNSFRDVEIDKKYFQKSRIIKTRIPNKLLNLSLSLLRWPKLDKLIAKKIGKKIDAFFFMDPRPAPVSKMVKKIMTFHDLSFDRYPKNFSFKTRLWHKFLRPKTEAKTSDRIIAVSDFTAKELTENYSIPSEKISRVYHGISRHFQDIPNTEKIQQVLEKYHLKHPFILTISTLEPRKNINTLIKAVELLNKKLESRYELVIVGQKDLHIFREPCLEKKDFVRFIGFIPFEDKIALYSSACAYAGLSFYEGFCFPILEAMRCGCPVVASNCSVMPEIVKEYGMLVDSFDIEGIAGALEKAIMLGKDNPVLQQAKEYARTFTWRRCAERTMKVLAS